LFKENGVNPVGGCLPMVIQIPVFIALYNVLLSSVELYQTEFLYLKDLSSLDPYGILPLTVMALFLLQQQFTPTGNMDPVQARMMKLMPIIFGLFFFTFPSGLVVYIFVNTTLSVLQQWYIRRTFATAPTPAEAGSA
jgi:YidC/Oxa1 family membrane protein insertase